MSSADPSQPGVPTLDQLQQLKRVREAALIRRWTSGSSLTPEEMSEISHILPPAHLANPPAPKARYQHDYSFYAEQLGYDVRNIKRLVRVGKLGRILPPFDEPGKLGDWWERMRILGHLKQQVPQRISDFLARLKAQPPAAPVADNSPPSQNSSTSLPTPPPDPPSDKNPGTTKVNFADLEAIGLEAAVQELTIQLSASQRELRTARELGLDDVTINRRQKTFDTTLDSLRKTEKSWQDLQKDRGDLAPVSDFRKDLTTIATTLRGMMRRRADNICAALADTLTPEQLGLMRAAIETEGEREQILLRTARHWHRAPDGSIITD